MKFVNEDGLIFSCKPLKECYFDCKNNKEVYTITISLDDELYAVNGAYNARECKSKSVSFVGKYKIPVAVYSVVIDDNNKFQFNYLYDYKYEYYLKREPSTYRNK